MRRTLSVLLVLALMGGFALGVNRFLASRRHIAASAKSPTATHAVFTLPGALYLVQEGTIYKLEKGSFSRLPLPATLGAWMEPAAVPGTTDLVAVARSAAYSDVYLIDSAGRIIRQLSHNATGSSTIQLNHWMFWPRVAADGDTVWVSYDSPKSQYSYEIELAIWKGSLSHGIAAGQWTSPFGYTGGDVDPVPLPGGALLYSKYQINGGAVFSRIALQSSALADPVYLTAASDDCSQPSLASDGTTLAMVCTGGTGMQSTRLQIATLQGTTLVNTRVLVPACLCAAPSWSPDGTGLVYLNPSDATGHFQLWWIAAAAGKPKPPRQVTQGLDFDATSPPAWSGATA